MNNDSRKRAVQKYKNMNNYKALKIESKGENIDIIREYAKMQGISITKFIIDACKYFINRGELPPE